ncbi:Haloalkane dehalogenase [Streptomyces sp. YIM 130001]|uniref:alpha/beta fold hydrolase n=1 Tax=Streptomyces sp. YIM 130001 TaxID=2259644 RepID=UPI000E65DA04|nr:alpha/beta hydrolase [Streptomyces sp. YIM 130001]RII20592.1 Haloalkane dehalogenase [Streptomyces sp. YIM 130001]
MLTEHVRRLSFRGLEYGCRIIENPVPSTEPIIMVGGAFQDMYAFRRLERPWTEVATVVTVDLPGSGSADHLPGHYGFDFLTGALDDLLGQLDLGPVNLFGASYGVPVVYPLAQQRPELVRRLLLVGASMRYPAEGLGRVQEMADHLAAGQDMSTYGRACVDAMMAHPDRPVRNRTVAARMVSCAMSSISGPEIPRHLASTQRLLSWEGLPGGGIKDVPALCFTGEYDEFALPELGREVAATIEDGTFTLMRETDHLPNLERGKEFARLVTDYFTDRPLERLDFLTPLECPSRDLSPVP